MYLRVFFYKVFWLDDLVIGVGLCCVGCRLMIVRWGIFENLYVIGVLIGVDIKFCVIYMKVIIFRGLLLNMGKFFVVYFIGFLVRNNICVCMMEWGIDFFKNMIFFN